MECYIAGSVISDPSAPLYKRLIDEGLINSTFGFEVFDGDGFFTLIFSGESSDPKLLLSRLTDEIERVKAEGLDKSLYEMCIRDRVSGYLKSREVSVLLNLLRVVDNPLSDIPITSVMLSPMFMFSADEVAEIRLINKEHNIYTNLYDALGIENDKPIFSKEDMIYTKSKFLYDFINELRLLSTFYTLPELSLIHIFR